MSETSSSFDPYHKKIGRGYQRLFSQKTSFDLPENTERPETITRTTSSWGRSLFGSRKKSEENVMMSRSKSSRVQKEVKAHPVLKILETPSKKATSKPEFLRYVEYLKEAGSWDSSTDTPVIYFK